MFIGSVVHKGETIQRFSKIRDFGVISQLESIKKKMYGAEE